MNYKDMNSPYPSTRIIASALTIGSIAFAVGFVGPLLLSDSNLGPLLGIFVTGPLGMLVGALVGIVRSVSDARERTIRSELWWLGAVWTLSLFYSWIAIFGLGWIELGLQGAVVIVAAFILFRNRPCLPAAIGRGRALILSAAGLVMVASIVPPIVQPDERAPRFAFFLDTRFDASRTIPEYVIDRTALVQEWILIVAITAVLIVSLQTLVSLRSH